MKATSVVAIALAIAGCAPQTKAVMRPKADATPMAPPSVSTSAPAAPASAGALTAALSSGSSVAAPADVAPVSAAEMVIYAGGVSMLEEPERFPVLIDRIIDLAESMGGRLQARRDDGVSIRVPSLRFRQAMSRIDGLGTVTHRSVAAEDVSEEFHDAEVRLENLRATRKRLQDLLAKANDIPATLTVEKELERVTQEIDRIEGRMRFLASRAAFSTIDVQLAPAPKLAPVVVEVAEPVRRRGVVLPIRWLDRLDAGELSTFE